MPYFSLPGAIVAGVAGTTALTLLAYLGPYIELPRIDFVRMLGTFFTADKDRATIIGSVLQVVNGIVLAVIYAALWYAGVGTPTWWWGLVFGLVHGVIAYASLPVILKVHPRPPSIDLGFPVFADLIVLHLVYGLTVALVYAGFLRPWVTV